MIKKKVLADAVNEARKVLTQNAQESQRFANEQIRINEILANFKWTTEEKLAQLSWMNSHLQSRVDKQQNTIDELLMMCEWFSELLQEDGDDIKTIKALFWMLIDALDLHIEETPAVEAKTYMVAWKSKKEPKKVSKKTKK